MTLTKLTISVTSLLLLSAPAFAENGADRFKVKSTFCTPIEELEGTIQSCEDNDNFVTQGEACLDKLDAESKSVSAMLPALFSKNVDQRQAGKFDSSIQDEKMASASLLFLIGTTELAMNEIRNYKANLADPPDADEMDVHGGDIEGYRSQVECFGVNRSNLESLLKDFDRRLNEFRQAKKVADAHTLTSEKNRKGVTALDSASGQKILTGKAAGSAVKAPVGTSPKKASSITGVEVDAKKRGK